MCYDCIRTPPCNSIFFHLLDVNAFAPKFFFFHNSLNSMHREKIPIHFIIIICTVDNCSKKKNIHHYLSYGLGRIKDFEKIFSYLKQSYFYRRLYHQNQGAPTSPLSAVGKPEPLLSNGTSPSGLPSPSVVGIMPES